MNDALAAALFQFTQQLALPAWCIIHLTNAISMSINIAFAWYPILIETRDDIGAPVKPVDITLDFMREAVRICQCADSHRTGLRITSALKLQGFAYVLRFERKIDISFPWDDSRPVGHDLA